MNLLDSHPCGRSRMGSIAQFVREVSLHWHMLYLHYYVCRSCVVVCCVCLLGRAHCSCTTYRERYVCIRLCSLLVSRSEEHGVPSEGGHVAIGWKGKDRKGHSKLGNAEAPNPHGRHRRDKGKGKSQSASLGTVSQHTEDNGLGDSSLAILNSGRKKGKRRHVAENKAAMFGHISSKRLKAYGVTVGTATKRKGKVVRDRKRRT